VQFRLVEQFSASNEVYDPEGFKRLAQQYPALFFPAFDMQRRMQERVMGVKFWAKLAKTRVLGSGKTVVTIRDVIGFHSDKKACKEIAQPKVQERDKFGNRNAEFVDLINLSKIRHVHIPEEEDDASIGVEDAFDK
jgi:hypothetical protein